MSLRLYFDENVPGWFLRPLEKDGVDVLTVQQDGRTGGADPGVLRRAVELGRVLVTRDKDFHAIERAHLRAGHHHHGIIHYPSGRTSHATALADLRLLALAMEPEELRDLVKTIPF